MSDDSKLEERVKLALNVLIAQIQTHERYHTQKESMCWLIAAAYLGATVLLVGREPYWQGWSVSAFSVWLILLFITACAAIIFLQSQLPDRHRAAAFFVAANDVATSWAAKLPAEAQLQSTELLELDNMLVPTEVEQRFHDRCHSKSSLPQRVTLVLIGLWSLAAAAYVVGSYTACAAS